MSTGPLESVVVLLAGPPGRVATWYSTFMADNRFRVLSFATDAEDLNRKLAGNPEVVVLDASIFPGPPPLIEALTRVSGVAHVVLPMEVDPGTRQTVAEIPSVKGVYVGDVNLAELLGKIHADAQARRHMAPDAGAWAAERRPKTPAVAGLRIVAVWNQAGGSGKSTVATNLAYEAASRGIPTLLIGLGAPDVVPLMLGLKATPNITFWQANPSPEGLKAALQKVGELDVLAGFPDVLAETRALSATPEAPESVTRLAMTAAYAGYAAIILDTPHSGIAALALVAANTVLLVARPTLADAWCSVEAYRTLQERMAGQHRVAPENVMVVLNRARKSALSASEWHNSASQVLGRSFPAVVAEIPEDPEVEPAQNNGKLPLLVSDSFARSIHVLGDTLFGGVAPRRTAEDAGGRRVKVGPISFRLKD